MGFLAYEPLCRGLLTGKFRTKPRFPATDQRSWDERFQGAAFLHGQRLTRSLSEVAERVGCPTAAVAIGWVCAQPGVTAALVGAKRAHQVEENVVAANLLEQTRVWSVVSRIAALHGGTPRM